ncbi:HBR473Wp [Eremothecium sinecaudum]|uniref:HBR473Wp n=1 Tax=Eremothecium sinecaudum TaxID=45286 RepID=A0A109UXL9_9SACH|nr:HBR473Wp [Eremothecium sinecaudum]AMD19374.1 HBR473Wp [Eremothecium sinecaudum]
MSIENGYMRGFNGALDVFVRKARDLPNLRKLDKQDPFVKLRISHLTKVSDAVHRGGQAPVFDFHVVFDMTPDMRNVLFVELYDDRKNGPRLIGKCEVDLKPALLSDPDDGYYDWYNLSVDDAEAGKIYIEMTFTPHKSGPLSQRSSLVDFETNRIGGISARQSPQLSPYEASYSSSFPSPPSEFATSFSNERLSQSAHSMTYKHAVMQRKKPPPPVMYRLPPESQLASQRPMSMAGESSTNFPEFTESVGTFNSFGSNASQDSRDSGITAKLKQLKEKWHTFKHGNTEKTGNTRANVDLEALQKIVGITSEERPYSTSSSPIRSSRQEDNCVPSLPPCANSYANAGRRSPLQRNSSSFSQTRTSVWDYR